MTMNLHTRTSTSNSAAATSVLPLESGVKPWVCPWKRNGILSGIPSNFATTIAYSGMNIMLLWCSAAKQGFNDSRWLTYKQAQALGAQVRKGARGGDHCYFL